MFFYVICNQQQKLYYLTPTLIKGKSTYKDVVLPDFHYTDKVVSRRSDIYNDNDRHTYTVSAVSAVVQVLVQAKQRIDSTSLQRLKSFTSYLAIYHGVLLADIVSFTEHHTMYSLYLYISRYRWRNNG